MADRTQLAKTFTNLLAWINTAEVNPATLAEICTADIAVPIPYPGFPPDLTGLVGVTQKIHAASPDWTMTLEKMIIDQTEGRVVCLCRSQGTQAGEWLGIPPTGKKFDTLGFISIKVDPNGKISELSILGQDLLFLQQLGVVPFPPQ